jgi:hypothetical protein
MEFLGDLIGTAASVGSGGLFGILGSGIGQISKYFQKKQERVFQREKWNHEKDLLQINMRAKQQETEQELAIVSQQGSWQGLDTSIEADAMLKPISDWAIDAKALFRSFITIMMWIIAFIVFYMIVTGVEELTKWFTQVELKELIKYMVYTIFFTASTATLWWFADRSLTPPEFKNR